MLLGVTYHPEPQSGSPASAWSWGRRHVSSEWGLVRQVTPAILSCPVVVAVDSGGTVVLVSQDGIQRPPFRFPKGGHLLQFLSCLENGLLPHGQLDPPLWSQRGKVRDQLWGPRGGWGAASCGVSLGGPCIPL